MASTSIESTGVRFSDNTFQTTAAVNPLVLNVFYENERVISFNFTLSANKNTMTIGPITIDTQYTITIPDQGYWVIV